MKLYLRVLVNVYVCDRERVRQSKGKERGG